MKQHTLDEIKKIKINLIKEKVYGMTDVDEIRKVITDILSKDLRKELEELSCEEAEKYLNNLRKCPTYRLCNEGVKRQIVGNSCESNEKLLSQLRIEGQ